MVERKKKEKRGKGRRKEERRECEGEKRGKYRKVRRCCHGGGAEKRSVLAFSQGTTL